MTNEETLSAIHRKVGEIGGRIDELCDRLERHDHTLYGNGGPGLTAQLAVVQSHVTDLRGAESSARSAANNAKVAVGGGVVAILTAVLQWLGIRI